MKDSLSSIQFPASTFWRLLPQGMRRRWWWFRPFDSLCRHWPKLRRRRGLLAIRMDGIGDMILFRQSLDHYPSAFGIPLDEITVIGCNSWRSISNEIFRDINVVTIDEHRYARNLFYRLFVNMKVWTLAPDVTVVDAYFRRAMMSDSLAWVANARRTVVALPYINKQTQAEYTWYMSQGWEVINTGSYPEHETKRHTNFVTLIAGREFPMKGLKIEWRNRPPRLELPTYYAVLNPGSNEYGRRWPFANYVKLAGWLREEGLTIIFVGKANENFNDDLLALLEEDKEILDLTGRSTLPELFDIMKGASIVISNDTGPAHAAIALGLNTVVIVGGGHFGCFFPYPSDFCLRHTRFLYERMECYHCFWRCHKRTDLKASFPCIEAVSINTVQAACRELLALDSLS